MSNWPLRAVGLGLSGPIFIPDDTRDVSLGLPQAAPGWGAWVQAVATMPFTAEAITVRCEFNEDTQPRRYLVRLGVGAAGNEVPIATFPFWIMTGTRRGIMGETYTYPIRVAQGQRVALSLNTGGGTTATAFRAAFIAHPSSLLDTVGYSRADLVGVDEATMQATVQVTTGFRSQVITEVVAATQRTVRAISLSSLSVASPSVGWEVLVGPAGAESPLMRGITMHNSFGQDTTAHVVPVCPVSIPPGTRISVRGPGNGPAITPSVAMHLFS